MGIINEKGLPTSNPTPVPASRWPSYKRSSTFLLGTLALCSVVSYRSTISNAIPQFGAYENGHAVVLKDQCSQVDPITPQKTTPALDEILDTISSPAYKNQSIAYLSGAVKIPTVSRDVMGPPGEDERWEIFYEFAAYLQKTFPLVHEKLQLEKINTHGLFYTWQGQNSDLKPTLLLAHQDVVPVPASTIPTWTHPPFSGFFDGTEIWGRGSSDDKNQLIAIFEAIELLLKADFSPERTVLISLGFDEESSGYAGAGTLASHILSRYGPNSIATVVDEGSGISEIWGHTFASPGVAEKGAIDVHVTIRMPGGHSSVPPPHTSIGVISELISLVESNTYPTYLDGKNPYYSQMVCGAAHAPDFPKSLKKLLSKTPSRRSCGQKDALAEEAAKESLFTKYLMTTSIAVDVIVGGEKSNALPEESTVTINHRVNIGDSTAHVKSKLAHLAKSVADKHNLTVSAFTGEDPKPSSITLSTPHELQVAPVTPTLVNSTTAYSVLSGTIRALYGEDMIVSPGLMTGNTDTRFYWELSENIFRFAPGYEGKGQGKGGVGKIHTVDESVNVENHFAAAKWYVLFIRNMDEATLA
ncbi:peptidase family M20/M25/M40 [Phlyctema vagabunda]|uniref:Peptidase family M20/M25/M40 n=1 Tax=Phlyctema vagabunda TaxID=108571 RepID=A0ABR4PI51_9HELO